MPAVGDLSGGNYKTYPGRCQVGKETQISIDSLNEIPKRGRAVGKFLWGGGMIA